MKKKIVGFLGAGVLVSVFGLFSDSAQAALSFGALVGWYSPNFGEVNDYLAHRNTIWDTGWKFEEGMMYGVAVEYEITPSFKLRGEWNRFKAETSDSDGVGWMGYHAEYKLNLNAYTLSGIYTMSPKEPLSPYIGIGLGQFVTKFRWDEVRSIRGTPVDASTGSQTEGPIGFQALIGIEFGTETLLLWGEARYISAQVEMEDFESLGWVSLLDGVVSGTTIDLAGLFLNVGAIIRF